MEAIIPPMPEEEPTHEDMVFNECCSVRALFQVPSSMPLVKETDDDQLKSDWNGIWDMLLNEGK